jgi:hypothetical protein
LQEAGIGYQYQNKILMRIDSQYLHKETIIPALAVLSGPDFSGPNTEFLEAHKLFRSGKYEQCLTECCKSFESTLKAIAALRNWPVNANDPASKLLDAAFNNNLIPSYLQTEFTSLKQMLVSGVPTIRNKASGHGAGAAPRIVPEYLAAFQLHQTAAAIVFFVAAHKANP